MPRSPDLGLQDVCVKAGGGLPYGISRESVPTSGQAVRQFCIVCCSRFTGRQRWNVCREFLKGSASLIYPGVFGGIGDLFQPCRPMLR